MVVRLEVSLNLKLIVEIPVGKPGVDVRLFGRTTINLLVVVIDCGCYTYDHASF